MFAGRLSLLMGTLGDFADPEISIADPRITGQIRRAAAEGDAAMLHDITEVGHTERFVRVL